jgi:hypothetical protein
MMLVIQIALGLVLGYVLIVAAPLVLPLVVIGAMNVAVWVAVQAIRAWATVRSTPRWPFVVGFATYLGFATAQAAGRASPVSDGEWLYFFLFGTAMWCFYAWIAYVLYRLLQHLRRTGPHEH